MKKIRRSLPLLLIMAGIALVCWPLGQRVFGWMAQRQLQREWSQSSAAVAVAAPASKPANSVSLWPATRIVIPELKIDAVTVDGFDEASLKRGPAHDPASALPGEKGNCVIAAHRNVYGAWFARVEELYAGSVVQLVTPAATYNYHTVSITRVSEMDRSVLQPPADGTARLTLITCTLPHSSDRIIVSAVLGDGL